VVWELCRIRWQIELFFKRCKSLLHLDALRADDPQLVRAFCTSKLIEVVLIELLTSEGRLFPPGAYPVPAAPRGSLWREMHLHWVDVVLAVYGRSDWRARLTRAPLVLRVITEGRRTRIGALTQLPRLTHYLQWVTSFPEYANGGVFKRLCLTWGRDIKPVG